MQLIDIGANLTHESFANDYHSVISEAKQNSVSHIILTGTDLQSSHAALKLAKSDPDYHSCTAGFHPHVASSLDQDAMTEIARICDDSKVVAVGETGLDYNRNFSPKSQQIAAFEQHLELASEIQKPMFLHQREAHQDFIKLLRRYRNRLCGGVVHCFTDIEEALNDYLELDMYIGITGWVCDERRGLDLQSLVPKIPLNRIMIETDAPYLLPRTLQPKPANRRNEPKYLREVLGKVAECYGKHINEIAEVTTTNAIELFNLRFQGNEY